MVRALKLIPPHWVREERGQEEISIFCYVKRPNLSPKFVRHTCRLSNLKVVTCEIEHSIEQGRIHGYLSRVRVGRGSDEIDQPSSWARAVSPKPPVNAEKAKCDGRTDRPTERVVESCARD